MIRCYGRGDETKVRGVGEDIVPGFAEIDGSCVGARILGEWERGPS